MTDHEHPRGGSGQSPEPTDDHRAEGGPDKQQQEWPDTEAEMRPRADHGEESYRGAGKLEGRPALITGGDSGIGRAVAIAFAREGADVAIAYLSESEDAGRYREVGRKGRAKGSGLSW